MKKKMAMLSVLLLMIVTTLKAQIVTDVPCNEANWGRYYPSTISCRIFYICAPYYSVLWAYECPPGLHFSMLTETCDFPFLIIPPCTLPDS